MAGQAVPDSEVLADATAQQRILVTLNRKHFIQLHASGQPHTGIVVCTFDPNVRALADRVDVVLSGSDLTGQLARVNRPASQAPRLREGRGR